MSCPVQPCVSLIMRTDMKGKGDVKFGDFVFLKIAESLISGDSARFFARDKLCDVCSGHLWDLFQKES